MTKMVEHEKDEPWKVKEKLLFHVHLYLEGIPAFFVKGPVVFLPFQHFFNRDRISFSSTFFAIFRGMCFLCADA